jgi:hypothetical protein
MGPAEDTKHNLSAKAGAPGRAGGHFAGELWCTLSTNEQDCQVMVAKLPEILTLKCIFSVGLSLSHSEKTRFRENASAQKLISASVLEAFGFCR